MPHCKNFFTLWHVESIRGNGWRKVD